MPTPSEAPFIRVPIMLRGKECEQFMKLKAKLENDIKRPITIAAVIRLALDTLAKQKI